MSCRDGAIKHISAVKN